MAPTKAPNSPTSLPIAPTEHYSPISPNIHPYNPLQPPVAPKPYPIPHTVPFLPLASPWPLTPSLDSQHSPLQPHLLLQPTHSPTSLYSTPCGPTSLHPPLFPKHTNIPSSLEIPTQHITDPYPPTSPKSPQSPSALTLPPHLPHCPSTHRPPQPREAPQQALDAWGGPAPVRAAALRWWGPRLLQPPQIPASHGEGDGHGLPSEGTAGRFRAGCQRRALPLSQLELAALPLTNQRPGAGQKCCRLMRSRQGRDGTAANLSESNGGEMELPLTNERPLGIGKSCC